jgi:hypothetical protein
VRYLNRRVRDGALRNVHVLLADPADPLLPEPVDPMPTAPRFRRRPM